MNAYVEIVVQYAAVLPDDEGERDERVDLVGSAVTDAIDTHGLGVVEGSARILDTRYRTPEEVEE